MIMIRQPDRMTRGRARLCHALRELRRGAAEAARVRSMQGRHLLLQELSGDRKTHIAPNGEALQ
jgi:hypothetical protein